MLEIENMAATINLIDWDSVFYYIASGNYPSVGKTFWKNINKVSGEHHVKIGSDGDVQDKNRTMIK